MVDIKRALSEIHFQNRKGFPDFCIQCDGMSVNLLGDVMTFSKEAAVFMVMCYRGKVVESQKENYCTDAIF